MTPTERRMYAEEMYALEDDICQLQLDGAVPPAYIEVAPPVMDAPATVAKPSRQVRTAPAVLDTTRLTKAVALLTAELGKLIPPAAVVPDAYWTSAVRQ